MARNKRKHTHSANYVFKKEYGEKNTKDSLTVPGESYTVNQLLERARSGVPIAQMVNVKKGYFDEGAEIDDFAPEPDFDLVDIENMAHQSSEIIHRAKEQEEQEAEKVSPTSNESEEQAIKEQGVPTPDSEEKPLKTAKNP